MVLKLLGLVLPLGLDSFAVCAAVGALGLADAAGRVRVSALFTAFEAGMPLVGLLLGAPLGHAVGSAATYVAAAVLIAFGLDTLRPGRDEDDEPERLQALVAARGRAALGLGLSISIDELAIGFSLGLLRLPIWLVVVVIAAQTIVVTQLGLRLGDRMSARRREGAQRLAGIALTGLGFALVTERLLA